MTNEDIIGMAVEAGFADAQGVVHAAYQLERFANLVADAEREACAVMVENYALQYAEPVWAVKFVNAIRARSQS
jgi:hypothetical protein